MKPVFDNEELLEIFYEEANSLINEMKQDISLLSPATQTVAPVPSSDEPPVLSDHAVVDQTLILKRLFRCAHIIRTNSQSVGLDHLECISGALEHITKKSIDESIVMVNDIISLLLEGVEACQKLLNHEEVFGYEALTKRFNRILPSYGGQSRE